MSDLAKKIMVDIENIYNFGANQMRWLGTIHYAVPTFNYFPYTPIPTK